MRIFVTGASGFVGKAVVKELINAGHQVIGLARSAEAASVVMSLGAEVHIGTLEQPESLRHGAASADAVIHTAFDHDFSRFRENCENDRRVIEVLADALSGTKKPLVVTSALGILPKGQLVTEQTLSQAGSLAHPRVASEEAADAAAKRGVHTSVIRLPPSVHGEGDHAFVPMLIHIARQKGLSVYAGAGQNNWPAVHRLDVARLFRLVVEKGCMGARYHAVAEAGIPFHKIAEVIGRKLNLPVISKSAEEAAAHFGWFAHFAAMDITASSASTQEHLGWRPTQMGLIADIEGPSYSHV